MKSFKATGPRPGNTALLLQLPPSFLVRKEILSLSAGSQMGEKEERRGHAHGRRVARARMKVSIRARQASD